MITMKVAKKVEYLMKREGHDAHWLGDLLDKSYHQARRYLNGESALTLEQVEQLAKWFGVPISWFFDEATSLNAEVVIRKGKRVILRYRVEEDVTIEVTKAR